MAGVAAHDEQLGDDAMQAATGRHPDEWFAAFDAAGATEWGHTRMARWLTTEHGVDGWWAQSITIRYEQARGLRLPGQQSDGTFAVSASKTLPIRADAALDLAIRVVADELGAEPVAVSTTAKHPTARWRDGSDTVQVRVSASGASGDRTSVTLTRSGMADGSRVDTAKPELVALLQRMLEQ